ncbi:MAG: C-type lectin domain-containing protein [Kofleriaceae bacterium]|nr:C-type lectin domain-containing protein [Kofleriaceae bacterium]
MRIGTTCALWLGIALTGCGVKLTDSRVMGRPDSRPDALFDAGTVDAAPLPCVGGLVAKVNPANNHCYLYFDTAAIRDAAVATCSAAGGATLASITTAAEHQFVADLVGASEVLLGGTDTITEGVFRWDTNELFSYAPWRAGEPNNGMNNFQEDCVVMQGQLIGAPWDDRPCDAATLPTAIYPFVCERPR